MFKKYQMDTKLSHNRISYYTGLIMSFTGISSIILGLVVLFGWYTGNDTLIRLYPSLPAIQYNTALSFIFCGISIVGITFSRILLSIATVSIVLVISLITLAEYITGSDLYIDTLLIFPVLPEDIQFPGRMSLNTSINFILTAASIYTITIGKRIAKPITNFITGVLGSLINTFACITIIGYITGLSGVYNWGYFIGMGMSLTTASGFLLLGSGIVASSWYEGNDGWTEKAGAPRWLPIAIAICLLTVTLNIWTALRFEKGIDLYHPLDDIIMLLGVIAAVLLAIVVYFYQRLKINTKNIEDANTHLKVEIEVRKQIEQHLKKAQQIAKMGSWEWNIVTNHLSWSENIFNIFGLAVSEFGATYEAFLNSVHPDDREFVIRSVNEALYENKSYSIDHRIVHPDGTLRIVHEQAEVTFDKENKPVMMIGTVQDVTEHTMLEQQLIQSQKMEAVGRLTGGIAHDFNNMLTALIGYTSLLKLKIPTENPVRNYVEKIDAITSKATTLVQSLLTFSRKQGITLSMVEVNTLIHDNENILSKLISEDTKFNINLSKSPMTILANSGQVTQILMNLISNAADATGKKGTITLSSELVELNENFLNVYGYGGPGRYACISVSDTGDGIPQELKGKIFEPFFTTKEVGKGTGLGLSIIYGIVKGHNAYIDVSSRQGEGANFKVYFPIKPKV